MLFVRQSKVETPLLIISSRLKGKDGINFLKSRNNRIIYTEDPSSSNTSIIDLHTDFFSNIPRYPFFELNVLNSLSLSLDLGSSHEDAYRYLDG